MEIGLGPAVHKEDCHIAVDHIDSAVGRYIDLAAVHIDPEVGYTGFVAVHYVDVAVDHIELGVGRTVAVHYTDLVVGRIDPESGRTDPAVGCID